jgi:mxaC protein
LIDWLAVAHPAWLLLLPVLVLPLLGSLFGPLRYSSLSLLPPDRASRGLALALRVLGALALALLVLALAGPYVPSYQVERSGKGAEIVLLLDRSRSMDQAFGTEGKALTVAPGGKVLGYQRPLGEDFVSKGMAARQVLSDFVGQRQADRFAMVVFSTLPLRVLEFTEKQHVVEVAVAAGDLGRGLSETDIGAALLESMTFFQQRAYTGSRIVLLVSDGGDHLHPDLKEQLAVLMRQHRISIYWLYLRSFGNPGLSTAPGESDGQGDSIPERTLNRFFSGLEVPYRAYEVENPDALREAVAEVNRLENLPITYTDTVARRDLTPLALAGALACVMLLAGAAALGVNAWR